MNPTKLIATYSRVSTARQEEEQTIKTQLLVLKEFAEKNGYTVVKEYTDEGWSGDILARPSLDELRTDAKKKIWQGVLMYDPDRLARRYSYQELVTDELREAGIEVIFVTVSGPKNSEDKILHGVRGLFAEYERTKISERFRLGKLRKVKEGHVLVSEAPYGYRYIPKQDTKQGYYEINAEEAKVVNDIFRWVSEDGLTLRKIVRKLQFNGVLPRKNKNGVWSTSTLSTLLRNTTYIGEAVWGSTYAVIPEKPLNVNKYRKMKKTSKKARPKEEWIKIPVPAIIEASTFQIVQDTLRANLVHARRNKKNEYLLANKIFCACGRRRTGEGPQHGKFLYYRCSDRVRSFPLPANCDLKGINARIADQLVWDKVVELMCSPDLIIEQLEKWVDKKQAQVGLSFIDIKENEKEISKLKEHEDRYAKAYGAGLFTVEKLHEYITPIREKILCIQSKNLEAQNSNDNTGRIPPSKQAIKDFAVNTVGIFKDLSFQARRAIILLVVDKIIGKPGEIHVFGIIPINENVQLFPCYRNRQDTNRHAEASIIPFEFTINLPPPLKSGVDYGFKKRN